SRLPRLGERRFRRDRGQRTTRWTQTTARASRPARPPDFRRCGPGCYNPAMPPGNRRSAMRVKDGRVQKKNNWRLAPDDYHALAQDEIRIDRRDPAWGHRHLITVAQLREFVALLPDWDEVAIGL